jgi:hypothetical protein
LDFSWHASLKLVGGSCKSIVDFSRLSRNKSRQQPSLSFIMTVLDIKTLHQFHAG